MIFIDYINVYFLLEDKWIRWINVKKKSRKNTGP